MILESSDKAKKAEQLEKNRQQGKEFEEEAMEKFKQKASNAKDQVTLKTESGVRTRIDAIGNDNSTGKLILEEDKSSRTAPLTSNQKKAFPEIEKSGAEVVGKGKGEFKGGTKIPPTKVDIIRP
jgi:hypothetical protein